MPATRSRPAGERTGRQASAGVPRRSVLAAAAALVLLGATALFPGPVGAAETRADAPAPAASRTAPTAGAGGSDLPTAESIQGRIKAVEADKALPEAVRDQAAQAYREAAVALTAASAHRQSAAEYRQSIDTASVQAAALRKSLADAASSTADVAATDGVTERTPIPSIEQRLLKEQAALAAVQKRRDDTERQLVQQSVRPNAVRDELSQARQSAARIESELAAPPARDQPPALADAKQTLLRARFDEQRALIDRLEQEILSYAPRLQLASAERDAAAGALERARGRVVAVQALLFDRRQAEAREAEAAARKAVDEVANQYPPLRVVAERNLALGQRLAATAENARKAENAREKVELELSHVEREFERVRPQLAARGRAAPVGETLLFLRDRLSRLAPRGSEIDALRAEVSRIAFDLQRLEDERQTLGDVSRATRELVSNSALTGLPERERSAATAAANRLLSDQRALLDRVVEAGQEELRILADLSSALAELDERLAETRRQIDGRLLWSQTMPPLDVETLREAPGAIVRVLGPDAWKGFSRAFAASAASHWMLALGMLAVAVAVAALRARWIALIAAAARPPATLGQGLGQTLRAALATLLIALPLPLLILAAARLALSGQPEGAGRGIALGLQGAGIYLLYGGTIRELFRPGGVAVVHFGWPAEIGRRAWEALRINLPLVALAVFVGNAAAAGSVADRSSLARLAFVASGLLFAFALHRILRRGPRSAGPPLIPYQRIWHFLAVAIPLLFSGVMLVGYAFAATQAGVRVERSYWLVLAVLALQGLGSRLLSLRRSELASRPAVGPELDGLALAESDRRARFLLRGAVDFAFVIGLWMTWRSLLPALDSSEAFHLWTRTAVNGGVEQRVPVTLADVALAIVVAVLTAVAARNLPGTLQILLQRGLTRDASLRFAFAKVAQYLIIGVGTIAFFNLLGADWSKLQWLVAALGVGLGFGLQEVVANFVCGLIILFERPIRVGDTVTVGDVTGTVSQISIRATHLVDFDRRSVVVPNKSLITDRVTNWTLSDQVTRLLISVGVAYGSDPERVKRIILDAIAAMPRVLRDPAPSVTFARFADSALEFESRLFVDSMDARLAVTHDFHVAVERALRENGIEIPFPQRDLHIRTVPAGLVGSSG
jgi:potassium efflux system protein